VLRNGFIKALQPSIDNAINIASVDEARKDKKFFQKRFNKKEEK